MKSLHIRKGNLSEINHLKKLANKERVPLTETKADVNYLLAEIDGQVIGFVGYTIEKDKARLKSDFVHPDYRGNGIYSALFNERIKRLDKVRHLDAFCTPLSLPQYLKSGFIQKKINKFGITYVTKDNSTLQKQSNIN